MKPTAILSCDYNVQDIKLMKSSPDYVTYTSYHSMSGYELIDQLRTVRLEISRLESVQRKLNEFIAENLWGVE